MMISPLMRERIVVLSRTEQGRIRSGFICCFWATRGLLLRGDFPLEGYGWRGCCEGEGG